MSSNEKVKPVALAVVELRFSEGRQSVSQIFYSVSRHSWASKQYCQGRAITACHLSFSYPKATVNDQIENALTL